ncbi:MAG TPA: Coq4 family protein, partial [Kofleriaceae bacterium]
SDRLDAFFLDPNGQRLYTERRAIDSRLDLDALAALPTDTLGYAYAHFLRSRGLTPDIFDGAPDGVRDSQVAYVIQRLRQTHDLWHVVTGYDTDTASEIALQAFSFGQLGAPSSLFLAAAGTLKGFREHHALPREALAGYRAGRRAQRLATFVWEDHWTTPLAEVRRMLHITPVTYAAAVARAAA